MSERPIFVFRDCALPDPVDLGFTIKINEGPELPDKTFDPFAVHATSPSTFLFARTLRTLYHNPHPHPRFGLRRSLDWRIREVRNELVAAALYGSDYVLSDGRGRLAEDWP